LDSSPLHHAATLARTLTVCGGRLLRWTTPVITAVGIAAETQTQLRTDLGTLAAAAPDTVGARTALIRVTADLDTAQSDGAISATKLDQIRTAATRVQADLTAAVTSASSDTPRRASSPPGKSKGKSNRDGVRRGWRLTQSPRRSSEVVT
jgi:hypothetical protein